MALPELRAYDPKLEEPADLDAFWADTLAEARAQPLGATLTPRDNLLGVITTQDVTFIGLRWRAHQGLVRPPARALSGCCPASSSSSATAAVAASRTTGCSGPSRFCAPRDGHAGAGHVWGVGDTPASRGARCTPGFLTRGSSSGPHYYRRLFMDAVRAIDAARGPRHRSVTGNVLGGSQGGGSHSQRRIWRPTDRGNDLPMSRSWPTFDAARHRHPPLRELGRY